MAAAADDRLAPLVVAAREGDAAATNELLREIFPAIVSYCRARITWATPGYAAADDVAQEICLAVVTGLPKYQEQGYPFMAFVYGIAAHKVADAKRNAFRHPNDVLDDSADILDEGEGPETLALHNESSAEVEDLLNTLSPSAREIIRLRVIVGMSAAETAAVLQSTPGAVRVAQYRALAKLRKEYDRRRRAARDAEEAAIAAAAPAAETTTPESSTTSESAPHSRKGGE